MCVCADYSFFKINLFILIGGYFTILYWFCHTSTWICHRYTRVPHPEPPSLPVQSLWVSQCTSPKHPVSCIERGLAIRFIYDIIHVSMPFSQIIPPSPSPTEPKRLFYTSVFLLLSRYSEGWYGEGGAGLGGWFRMGNTCIPVADTCWCMAKPIQYFKVISQSNSL